MADTNTHEQQTVTISAESLRWLVSAAQVLQLLTPFLKDNFIKEQGLSYIELGKALTEAGSALERL